MPTKHSSKTFAAIELSRDDLARFRLYSSLGGLRTATAVPAFTRERGFRDNRIGLTFQTTSEYIVTN